MRKHLTFKFTKMSAKYFENDNKAKTNLSCSAFRYIYVYLQGICSCVDNIEKKMIKCEEAFPPETIQCALIQLTVICIKEISEQCITLIGYTLFLSVVKT